MSSAHQGTVLHQLGRLFNVGTVAGLSEWQLLSRYLNDRDEVAFEALVARYGPMVLGVCRRILVDPNDVDDAFQATFLVLVRKATALGERDAIGHWLYGVAYRVALRARSQAMRRRQREAHATTVPGPPEADPSRFELAAVLDEELNRLPAKYRAPIVLCHLEGLTHDEAARQLDWPVGTVKGRLVRARELLRTRLSRRGLASALGVSTATFGPDALAAVVPESLRATTVATVMKAAAGPIPAGMVVASVATLLEGVLTAMFWSKSKTVLGTALILGILAAGAGVVAQQATTSDPAQPPAGDPAPIVIAPVADKPQSANRDESHNDSAPVVGTILDLEKLEKSQSRLAYEIFQAELRGLTEKYGAEEINGLARWSKEVVSNANQDLPDRVNALRAHLERMQGLTTKVAGFPTTREESKRLLPLARFYEREARLMLARATAELSGPVPSPTSKQGVVQPELDARSQGILKRLEEPVTMAFGNETPLEDVLKYIRQATATAEGKQIPIYVDPLALQEAEKTMTSPVTIDLTDVPLKTALRLLLRQLELSYKVKDGLLMITLYDPDEPSSPLEILEAKADRGELTPDEAASLKEMLKTLNEIQTLRVEKSKLEQEQAKYQQAAGGGGFR